MSNTASILNLSGFASLREIAALGGGQDFFTPRRQGAKRKGRLLAKKGPASTRGYSERVREQRSSARLCKKSLPPETAAATRSAKAWQP